MSIRPLIAPNTVATDYWHVLPDGRLQCDLCPRECKLRDGQQGLCFVRGFSGSSALHSAR